MPIQKVIHIQPTQNSAIVEAEKKGYASELIPKHTTAILDQNLRMEILKMPALEVTS